MIIYNVIQKYFITNKAIIQAKQGKKTTNLTVFVPVFLVIRLVGLKIKCQASRHGGNSRKTMPA